MGNRLYVQKEWRLLSWWLATYHHDDKISMNVRLGPTLPFTSFRPDGEVERNLSRLRNRWIDAVVITPGRVLLVEAKMEPDPGIFSQLVHYARRFRLDPNFTDYATWPIDMIALVYNDDPAIAEEAPWYGVRWVVYQPALDGVLPPQLRGGAFDTSVSELPPDWPARVSWLTGKPLVSAW